MPTYRYFLPDFLEIQRESFLNFLKKGILEEFSKRNPINSDNITLFFYPEYFCLKKPDYSIQQAIFFRKSYVSKLYIPVQYTDKRRKKIFLKWVLITQLPLMTKRGHFVLNGAARVIINQLVRSPGVYFLPQEIEIYSNKWASKPSRILNRFYADIICLKGTWVRISIDKDFCMWVRLKKGPKIPLLWFLLGMGLNEKMIFQSVTSPNFLLKSFIPHYPIESHLFISYNNKIGLSNRISNNNIPNREFIRYPRNPIDRIGKKIGGNKIVNSYRNIKINKALKYPYVATTIEAWKEIAKLFNLKKTRKKKPSNRLGNPVPKISIIGNKIASNYLQKSINRYNSIIASYPIDKQLIGLLPSNPMGINKIVINNKIEFNFLRSIRRKNQSYFRFINRHPYFINLLGGLLAIKIGNNRLTRSIYNKNNIRFDNYLISREQKIRTEGLLSPTFLFNDVFRQYLLSIAITNKKKPINSLLDRIAINRQLLGKKWFFQKFMNPKTYDLGKKGRIALNQKLQLNISTNQLTAQDLLFITDFLMKVERGIHPLDDIDHLKNKRIRSAGELIQMQFAIGLMRLEKSIRLKFHKKLKTSNYLASTRKKNMKLLANKPILLHTYNKLLNRIIPSYFHINRIGYFLLLPSKIAVNYLFYCYPMNSDKTLISKKMLYYKIKSKLLDKIFLRLNSFIQPKFLNGALKEFFGTHPLSQFMDQINPLSEITHKRRLTSLGPGGVARDTATLAIRGIHPSHYGRICPIETPEGKNTGLVNSLTLYARVNEEGFIQSPFYELYKGQILNNRKINMMANQEENFQIATPDLNITKKKFLPKQKIPIYSHNSYQMGSSGSISFIGISPLQMISVATSLIPFLEHDDANRALMGSNMQRQAVPILSPERAIIGTGLEAKAVSDSGHNIIASTSGFILYVSGYFIEINS